LNSFIDLSDQVPKPVSPTPNFVPHYPYVSESYDAGYVGDDSGNQANPESPIGNSTGWHFGEPFVNEEERISCDTEEEGGEVNQYRSRHYGQGEKDTNSMLLDLEMGYQTHLVMR
jgi:hypothetical protein